ncbi:MAG: recombinase family protein, partial [Actinobacteria bacterium]|nr:recombinase family protein [Actinomycetota bacterium]
GYEVLEEVVDPGQSGASLERPGMDRVRDLVDEGGVSVVLAQDRDRLARKVVLNLVLEEGFAQHGCRLQALNDYAGDGPEAALMRGIQGQFAEYERAYSIFEYWSLVDLAATLLVGGIAPAIMWMEHGENRVRQASFVIRLCTGTA